MIFLPCSARRAADAATAPKFPPGFILASAPPLYCVAQAYAVSSAAAKCSLDMAERRQAVSAFDPAGKKLRELHTGRSALPSLSRHPDRWHFARDQEGAAGCGLDLVDRQARSNLAQGHALSGDLKQPVVGDYQVDDPARRRRDRAAFDKARAAAAGDVLHRQKHVLGAGGEIHRAADAAALLPGH